jgi:hypothetical protein
MAEYDYLITQVTQLEAELVLLKHHIAELEHGNPEPSRNNAMSLLSEADKAYIAGFVDGEGAFTVNRRFHRNKNQQCQVWVGYSAYLEIGNTDKGVIDWLHDAMGITSNVYPQKQKGNRRIMYRLRISGKQSMIITNLILPFLRVKKGIAEKFLEFPLHHRKLDREKAIELFEEVRQINRNNGKGRASIKYPGQLSCVCRDLTGGIPYEDEEKVHSPKKLEGESALRSWSSTPSLPTSNNGVPDEQLSGKLLPNSGNPKTISHGNPELNGGGNAS